MVILMNINILDMALDLMCTKIFRYVMVVGLVKNVIIYGADMSLLTHVDNRKKDIVTFSKAPMGGSKEEILLTFAL